VWHTTYKGDTFESMRASYGVDVTKFNSSRAGWSQDAMLRDMTKITMSKKDTEYVTKMLSDSGKLFNQISGTTLRTLRGIDSLRPSSRRSTTPMYDVEKSFQTQDDMYLNSLLGSSSDTRKKSTQEKRIEDVLRNRQS